MLRALDMMNRAVVKIQELATVAEAIRLMKQQNSRSLIVDRRSDQDDYGILTETDVMYKVMALGKDPQTTLVADIMTKPCIAVKPDATIEEVALLFVDHKLLRAPVIQGKLFGMISVSALLSCYPAIALLHLEEELNQARKQAHQICEKQGVHSLACTAAMDIVDALQSELTYSQADRLLNPTFEEYSERFPEVTDSEFYANLCGG